MNTLHVKRDDTVIVISGDDKGVKGKVIAVSP
ncbi:MAG: KOW motif-containing protein, partial [Oscillospiraceae bacterium]|nr:KOW motif-containing protein [Oscillospiraceae bacterium]